MPPLVLVACGGRDPAISVTTAQGHLVQVADRVDTCFAKAGDVRRCTDVQALEGRRVVMRRARALALLAPLAATLAVASCGQDAQVWKGEGGKLDPDAVSVAPASTSVPDEPAMATNPADAPGPAGINPDGSEFGTTAPQPSSLAVKQDRAAMLTLRTAMSIIEGCHSGRPSYAHCDEQRELGARDELGIVFSDGVKPGEVKAAGTPKSVRITVRSLSGARFTVARSPRGDRFSCLPGPGGESACPETGTWAW